MFAAFFDHVREFVFAQMPKRDDRGAQGLNG
jgi:hypothetical protein